MGLALICLGLFIMGRAFLDGSWWYSGMTDRRLNADQRTVLRDLRDELAVAGIAPEVVDSLDAALLYSPDPTDVRSILLDAQASLQRVDGADPVWSLRLRSVITWIRPSAAQTDATLAPIATLGW